MPLGLFRERLMEAHKDRPPASETDRTLILETVISGIADPRRTAWRKTSEEAKGILASAEPEALRESLTRCYELLRCGEYTTLKGLLSEHLTEFPEHKPEILAFARKLVSTDPTSDWFEIDSGHGMNSSCLKLKDIEELVFWEPEKVVASSKWS